MAKLPKQERDRIREEVRRERMPFRPTSQNRFSPHNLEQIYHEHASCGKLNAEGYIAHAICSPLEYYVVKNEGIHGQSD
jgi:hypothetical protein